MEYLFLGVSRLPRGSSLAFSSSTIFFSGPRKPIASRTKSHLMNSSDPAQNKVYVVGREVLTSLSKMETSPLSVKYPLHQKCSNALHNIPATSAMFQRPALSFVHSTFIVLIPATFPFPSSTNSYKQQQVTVLLPVHKVYIEDYQN